MRRIEDMGINELFGIIRREPEGERRERALAAVLSSLIEVEIEWRHLGRSMRGRSVSGWRG